MQMVKTKKIDLLFVIILYSDQLKPKSHLKLIEKIQIFGSEQFPLNLNGEHVHFSGSSS